MYYNVKTKKFDPCCDDSDLKFSKEGCTCCWYCNNCGNRGCTNLVGYVNEEINTMEKENLYVAAFDCGKEFIEDERWDIIAKGLYRCLKDMYDDGHLNIKPHKFKAQYLTFPGRGERFNVEMFFEK